MSPSGVNNAWREHAARHARWLADNNGSLATGGTSTAITVTLNQQFSAWFDGLTFAARITTTCGATPTINPTGSGALGAKSLYWSGTGVQLAANDLTSTSVAWFMYEATSDKVYVFACPPVAGYAPLASANTFTASPQTIAVASAASLRLDRTDTHGDNVLVGTLEFRGRDSDGNNQSYGLIDGRAVLDNAGAETGGLEFRTGNAGSATQRLFLRTGLYTPNATSGDMGADTINASAVYDDGVKLGRTFVSEVSLSGGAGTTFSSIPAGVRRITVNLRGVSLDDTDSILIQLGTSGGLVATGYASTSTTLAAGAATTGYTTGFGIRSIIAANVFSGHMVLTHVGGNVWVASLTGKADTATTIVGGGDVSLGAELDRLAILDTGADNFDAGTISIMYEF